MNKRQRIFMESGGHCVYCGAILNMLDFALDHVYPTKKGGGNGESNLVASCHLCTRRKKGRTVEEFRKALTNPAFSFTQLDFLRRNGIELPENPAPYKFYFETDLHWTLTEEER